MDAAATQASDAVATGMTAVRTRLSLTPRGRLLAAMLAMAFGAALWRGDPHTRIAAALLAGPLLADWLATPRHLGRIRVHAPPRRVAAMAPFRERVRLELPADAAPVPDLKVREPAVQGQRDGWGWTAMLAGDGCRGTAAGGAMAHPTTVVLRARSRNRGRRPERVFAISTGFPLGLFRSRAMLRVPAELITEPARVALPRNILQRTARHHSEPEAPRRTTGGEFHSLREYQHGDDARTVHPLRSAATGTLVRRTMRGDPPQQWDLVLDLRLAPDRPLKRRGPEEVILPRHVWQAFEWQLGACATLLDRLLEERHQGRLWVLSAEGHVVLPLGGTGDTRSALAHLAEVIPSPWVPAEALLAEQLGQRPCLWLPAGGAMPEQEWHGAGIAPLVVPSPRDVGR